MLEQLRGRNLAHVGCTMGLTLGLFIGMLVAIAIIQIVRSATSVNWATFAWLGITAVLGGLGYVLGGRYSRRRWGDAEAGDQTSR
jgi:hypothetical protein